MDDFVEWPGIGKAYRLQPRGMSDYKRITTKQYETDDGHKLNYNLGKWTAHYKGIHTKAFENMLDAIAAFEKSSHPQDLG